MRQQLSFALLLLAACAPPSHVAIRVLRMNAPIVINAPRVEVITPAARAFNSVRSVFAYVEPPLRPIAVKPIAVARPAVVEVPQVPMASQVVEPPKPPAFTGRCIGRFGPDTNPLAAFLIDGAIVNARRGDTVSGFLVRAINIESVDLEPAGFPGAVQRVVIGQARSRR